MYHAISKNRVRKTFQLVNEHRYSEVVEGVSSTVEHRFAGDHALGALDMTGPHLRLGYSDWDA